MSPENERIGPVELRVSDESVEVVRLETPGRRLREHAHLVALPLAALWWGLSRPESVPSGLLFLLTVVVALPEMARQGIAFLGALGPGGLPIRRSLRIERLASSDGGYRTADAGRSRVLLDGAPLDAGRPLRMLNHLPAIADMIASLYASLRTLSTAALVMFFCWFVFAVVGMSFFIKTGAITVFRTTSTFATRQTAL